MRPSIFDVAHSDIGTLCGAWPSGVAADLSALDPQQQQIVLDRMSDDFKTRIQFDPELDSVLEIIPNQVATNLVTSTNNMADHEKLAAIARAIHRRLDTDAPSRGPANIAAVSILIKALSYHKQTDVLTGHYIAPDAVKPASTYLAGLLANGAIDNLVQFRDSIFSPLDDATQAQIASGLDARGRSGLHAAVDGANTGTDTAADDTRIASTQRTYAWLLEDCNATTRTVTVASHMNSGGSLLGIMMHLGLRKSIDAAGDLVKLVAPGQRGRLLEAAEQSRGRLSPHSFRSGLQLALANADRETVKTYLTLIYRFLDELSRQECQSLLDVFHRSQYRASTHLNSRAYIRTGKDDPELCAQYKDLKDALKLRANSNR